MVTHDTTLCAESSFTLNSTLNSIIGFSGISKSIIEDPIPSMGCNSIIIGRYFGEIESNTIVIGNDDNHLMICANGNIKLVKDGEVVNESLSSDQISGDLLNSVIRQMIKNL